MSKRSFEGKTQLIPHRPKEKPKLLFRFFFCKSTPKGSNQFLLNDIAGYIICKASEFPFTLGKLKVVVKKNKINVMENGTDQTVILEEKILP